jgi:hypothetical protein
MQRPLEWGGIAFTYVLRRRHGADANDCLLYRIFCLKQPVGLRNITMANLHPEHEKQSSE